MRALRLSNMQSRRQKKSGLTLMEPWQRMEPIPVNLKGERGKARYIMLLQSFSRKALLAFTSLLVASSASWAVGIPGVQPSAFSGHITSVTDGTGPFSGATGVL